MWHSFWEVLWFLCDLFNEIFKTGNWGVTPRARDGFYPRVPMGMGIFATPKLVVLWLSKWFGSWILYHVGGQIHYHSWKVQVDMNVYLLLLVLIHALLSFCNLVSVSNADSLDCTGCACIFFDVYCNPLDRAVFSFVLVLCCFYFHWVSFYVPTILCNFFILIYHMQLRLHSICSKRFAI